MKWSKLWKTKSSTLNTVDKGGVMSYIVKYRIGENNYEQTVKNDIPIVEETELKFLDWIDETEKRLGKVSVLKWEVLR